MKTKFFLPLLFFFACAQVQAQDFATAGTTEVGGSVSFSSQTQSDSYFYYSGDPVNTLIVSPYIGKMVWKGLELGFVPQLAYQDNGNTNRTYLNLFLDVTGNFNTQSKVYEFIGFLAGYNAILRNTSSHAKEDGMGIGFEGGIKVDVNSRSLLVFQLQYQIQNYSYQAEIISGTTTITHTINTFSAGLGFHIYIHKGSGT